MILFIFWFTGSGEQDTVQFKYSYSNSIYHDLLPFGLNN